MGFPARVEEYLQRIKSYGKENLADILHEIGEAVPFISRQSRFRLYLEDLTEGALSCMGAAGGEIERVRQVTFAINDDNFLVSRVYQQQAVASCDNLAEFPEDMPVVDGQGGGSYFLPLVHRGRSIGVVCLDRCRPGDFPR